MTKDTHQNTPHKEQELINNITALFLQPPDSAVETSFQKLMKEFTDTGGGEDLQQKRVYALTRVFDNIHFNPETNNIIWPDQNTLRELLATHNINEDEWLSNIGKYAISQNIEDIDPNGQLTFFLITLENKIKSFLESSYNGKTIQDYILGLAGLEVNEFNKKVLFIAYLKGSLLPRENGQDNLNKILSPLATIYNHWESKNISIEEKIVYGCPAINNIIKEMEKIHGEETHEKVVELLKAGTFDRKLQNLHAYYLTSFIINQYTFDQYKNIIINSKERNSFQSISLINIFPKIMKNTNAGINAVREGQKKSNENTGLNSIQENQNKLNENDAGNAVSKLIEIYTLYDIDDFESLILSLIDAGKFDNVPDGLLAHYARFYLVGECNFSTYKSIENKIYERGLVINDFSDLLFKEIHQITFNNPEEILKKIEEIGKHHQISNEDFLIELIKNEKFSNHSSALIKIFPIRSISNEKTREIFVQWSIAYLSGKIQLEAYKEIIESLSIDINKINIQELVDHFSKNYTKTNDFLDRLSNFLGLNKISFAELIKVGISNKDLVLSQIKKSNLSNDELKKIIHACESLYVIGKWSKEDYGAIRSETNLKTESTVDSFPNLEGKESNQSIKTYFENFKNLFDENVESGQILEKLLKAGKFDNNIVEYLNLCVHYNVNQKGTINYITYLYINGKCNKSVYERIFNENKPFSDLTHPFDVFIEHVENIDNLDAGYGRVKDILKLHEKQSNTDDNVQNEISKPIQNLTESAPPPIYEDNEYANRIIEKMQSQEVSGRVYTDLFKLVLDFEEKGTCEKNKLKRDNKPDQAKETQEYLVFEKGKMVFSKEDYANILFAMKHKKTLIEFFDNNVIIQNQGKVSRIRPEILIYTLENAEKIKDDMDITIDVSENRFENSKRKSTRSNHSASFIEQDDIENYINDVCDVSSYSYFFDALLRKANKDRDAITVSNELTEFENEFYIAIEEELYRFLKFIELKNREKEEDSDLSFEDYKKIGVLFIRNIVSFALRNKTQKEMDYVYEYLKGIILTQEADHIINNRIESTNALLEEYFDPNDSQSLVAISISEVYAESTNYRNYPNIIGGCIYRVKIEEKIEKNISTFKAMTVSISKTIENIMKAIANIFSRIPEKMSLTSTNDFNKLFAPVPNLILSRMAISCRK